MAGTPSSEAGVDRRQFVKGCLSVAGLGAVGAAGFGVVKPLAIVAAGKIKTVKYWGVKVIKGSPAPRGIPLIKVIVNEDGFLEGVPQDLDWYKYCSHEKAPGLKESYAGDNVLRYFLPEDKLHQAGSAAAGLWWYLDRMGQPIRASDLRDRPVGDGAAFNWRSAGASGGDIVTGILLKLDVSKVKGTKAFPREYLNEKENLIAVCSFCAHFCCVPGWHEAKVAEKYHAWDKIFCTCHNSRYDPLDIVEYSYELKELESEEEAGAEGGGPHA